MTDLTKLTLQQALAIQASEASRPAVDEFGTLSMALDRMTVLEAIEYNAKLAAAAKLVRAPEGWAYPTSAPVVRGAK